MSMKKKKQSLAHCCAVAIVGASIGLSISGAPLWASEQALVLEEVLVTARKRTENLMDAPVAVTAVSGDSMDKLAITHLEQVSAKVPGLIIGRAPLTATVYIRGVGSGINQGFEQSVGMYVDDVYQARSFLFTQSMVDLQQVEVLRGPQGTLFGRNTVAGAIKLTTASPAVDEELNGSVTLAWEPEYDTRHVTAVVSGSPADTLGIRLAVRDTTSDGYLDNVLYDTDVAQREDQLARLSLRWEPTDTLGVTGKFNWVDTSIALTKKDREAEGTPRLGIVNPIFDTSSLADYRAAGATGSFSSLGTVILSTGAVPFSPSTDKSYLGNPGWFPGDLSAGNYTEFESQSSVIKVDWELGNYSLTAVSSYIDFENRQGNDSDIGALNLAHNIKEEELQMFSQEIRLSSDFDGLVNFIAGVYYDNQDMDSYLNTTLDGTLGGVTPLHRCWARLHCWSPRLARVARRFSWRPWRGLPDLTKSSRSGFAALTRREPVSMSHASGIRYKGGRDSPTENQGGYEVVPCKTETFALFGEIAISFADNLILDIGGRYSRDEKNANNFAALAVGRPDALTQVVGPKDTAGAANATEAITRAFIAAGPEGAAVQALMLGFNTFPHNQDLRRTEDHFDPAAKLRWEYGDGGMAYLGWSESYKSGGFSSTPDTSNPDGTPDDGTEFDSELVEAWELGVKQEFMGGRARLSTTLYHQTLKDLQVTSFRGVSFVVSNAAELIARGVEVEGQLLLLEDLEIGGSITWLDHEFDSYPGAVCTQQQNGASLAAGQASCVTDQSGKRGAFAPKYSAVLFVDYNHGVGGWNLNAHVDLMYKDDLLLNPDLDPNMLQDGSWKMDARLGLSSADGRWEFLLYGRNLTDKTTYTYMLGGPLSAGLYAGYPQEPRIIGFQGAFHF